MAKVILISGSPRLQGNTRLVMDRCKEEIEREGLEAEVITLAGKDIKGCIGCYKCKQLGKCALNDGVNEIIDKIKEAQGLIVGAPVYFGTARGDLMNLLQRVGMVSKKTNQFLSWLVGGPIAVSRRGGVSATYQEMLMFFFISEMIVPGSNYWNIVFGHDPGDVLKDEEGINTVTRFAGNVAKLIKKIQ